MKKGGDFFSNHEGLNVPGEVKVKTTCSIVRSKGIHPAPSPAGAHRQARPLPHDVSSLASAGTISGAQHWPSPLSFK